MSPRLEPTDVIYRRNATHWVTSAKRPETRARRLAQLIDSSAGADVPKPFQVERRP